MQGLSKTYRNELLTHSLPISQTSWEDEGIVEIYWHT